MIRLLLLLLALLVAVPVTPAAAQSERPPCNKVISAVNREIGRRGGNAASPRAVARTLGTEPGWVRRCMAAYGRQPARRHRVSDEEREALERAFEEGRDVQLDEETVEYSWERKRELQIERKELRDHQREMQERKEFYQSDDPFYDMSEY